MVDDSYEEKRDFIRMRIETQVSYTLNGNPDSVYQGTSLDLSATGMYMVTDHKPKLGDQIDIIMSPSSDRLPPFMAEGKVVRCEVNKEQPTFFDVSVELTKTN